MEDGSSGRKAAPEEELTLQYPVHTLDGRLLLPAGTVLTGEVMKELASAGKDMQFQTHSLLEYGRVVKDIMGFLENPPYNTIFRDDELIIDLLQIMGRVRLALPALQSLDYFVHNDYYTYRHILMVFALATLLAKDLLENDEDQVAAVSSGPIHDMGKINIPLGILDKKTPLTETEHEVMKHHVLSGHVLLSYYSGSSESLAAKVARDHHERSNGSGYPTGRHLNDFMVEIIAVSDIYDALISPRPYRPVSFDNRTALEEITAMAERHEIRWDIVQALVSHNRRQNRSLKGTEISHEKRGTQPPGNVYGISVDQEG